MITNADKFSIELDFSANEIRQTAADVVALADGAERTAAAVSKLRTALRGLNIATERAAELRALGGTFDELALASAAAAREVERNAAEARKAVKEAEKLRKEAERQAAAMSDVARAAGDAADATAGLGAASRNAGGDVDSLTGETGDADAALGRMGEEADDAARAVRGLGDDARRADGALGGMGARVADIAKGAAAGILSVELLKKGFEALAAGVRFAIEAAGEYQQTTEEGRRRQEFFTEQLTAARLEIGRAVADSESYNDALVAIVEILPDVVSGVNDLVEEIDRAATLFRAADEATQGFRDAARETGQCLIDKLFPWVGVITDALTGVGEAYDYLAGRAEHAAQVAEWSGESIRTDIDGMAESARLAALQARDFEASVVRAFENVSGVTRRAALVNAAVNPFGIFDPGRPAAEAPARASVGGMGPREEREIANAVATEKSKAEALADIQRIAADAELERANERKDALIAIEETLTAKRIEEAERLDAARAALDEQRQAAEQARADQEAARAEDMQRRFGAVTDAATASYQAIAGGLGETLAASLDAGKDAEERAAAIVGGGLVDVGKSAVAMSAIKTIADPALGFVPNPAGGAALFGVGIAAIATGKAIGGSALTDSGGAPSAPREAPAREVQQGPRTTNNFTIQTGIGDPRAIALQVADAVNNAQKMGLINGAR